MSRCELGAPYQLANTFVRALMMEQKEMKNALFIALFVCLTACGGSAEETEHSVQSGHAVLVAEFESLDLLLTASDAWQTVGVLDVSAYGADLLFSSVSFEGTQAIAFDGMGLSRSGSVVARASEPLSGIDGIVAPLETPRLIREGEHVRFDVVVRINLTHRDLEHVFQTASVGFHAIAALPVAGVEIDTVVPYSHSFLRLCATAPVVAHQALTTNALTNGMPQDLYSIRIAARSLSPLVKVGSISFMIDGVSESRSLSRWHVRFDRDNPYWQQAYRVVDSRTHTDLTEATYVPEPHLTSGIVTVIFTGGLHADQEGVVMTVSATPSGFVTGDTLNIILGFRDFSSDVTGSHWVGDYIPDEGSLEVNDGRARERFLDPIIWTDGNSNDLYTGAYQITDLSHNETLTMH